MTSKLMKRFKLIC